MIRNSVGMAKSLAFLRPFLLLAALVIMCTSTGHSVAYGESYREMCDQSGELSASSVVVFGASYAMDWPIDSIGNFVVINKGVGGNQSFEMLGRFQSDVVDIHPNSVVIWGFINDIHRSPPESLRETKARIRHSYKEMIEEADRHGLRVIVATEVTLPEPEGFLNWLAGIANRVWGKTSYRSLVNTQVLEVNAWLRDFAQSKNIPVLEFQRVLSDSDGWRKPEYAARDGTHLSSTAYDALTLYTSEMIRSICDSAWLPAPR